VNDTSVLLCLLIIGYSGVAILGARAVLRESIARKGLRGSTRNGPRNLLPGRLLPGNPPRARRRPLPEPATAHGPEAARPGGRDW
jgi:hypothetical protein